MAGVLVGVVTLPCSHESDVLACMYREDCFSQIPTSDATLYSMVLYRGWLPSVASQPSCPVGSPVVRPQETMALSPIHLKLFRVRFALRLYPESMTAAPSSRSNRHESTTAPSVPSSCRAARRASAQSPPDGMLVGGGQGETGSGWLCLFVWCGIGCLCVCVWWWWWWCCW